MVEQQLLDEHPGPPDLAGGHRTNACQTLQCLRVNFQQPRGFREIERGHGWPLLEVAGGGKAAWCVAIEQLG